MSTNLIVLDEEALKAAIRLSASETITWIENGYGHNHSYTFAVDSGLEFAYANCKTEVQSYGFLQKRMFRQKVLRFLAKAFVRAAVYCTQLAKQ